MFLDLPHSKLDVYKCSRELVLECYRLSKLIPDIERFGLIPQLRRAATSVSLNIAEGCSRRTGADRRRFFEISRGSVVEIDSILDLFSDLGYCNLEQMKSTGVLLVRVFKMLSSMINKC